MKKHLKVILLIISLSFLQISSSYSNEEEFVSGISYDEIYDPLEPINRAVLNFNFFIDDIAIRPIVKTYKFIAPEPVEKGVSNFFSNLKEPWTSINAALQGDFRNSGTSIMRFGLNTTVGLLGIFDVATSLGFEKQKEDFGQTLAVYGVEPGPYLVLPLLGPSTVRDALGKVTGFVADPVTIALNKDGKENWLWIGTAVNGIDFREQNLEKIDNLEATSVDFYATIRSLYLERRNRMIRNQSADEQDPFQEFDIE